MSAGTSSGTGGNIFIPGSDLLLRGRNVIGKLEVLVATDLNANLIHSVNNLLFDTFWNRWEYFSLGFYFGTVKYNMTRFFYDLRKRGGI